MDFHPLSGEIVEVTVQLKADTVREMDCLVKAFRKKSRSRFIQDILEDWYRRDVRQMTVQATAGKAESGYYREA